MELLLTFFLAIIVVLMYHDRLLQMWTPLLTTSTFSSWCWWHGKHCVFVFWNPRLVNWFCWSREPGCYSILHCGLLIKKSRIQLHTRALRPRLDSLYTSFLARLKLINSILTQVWRPSEIVSSVDPFALQTKYCWSRVERTFFFNVY